MSGGRSGSEHLSDEILARRRTRRLTAEEILAASDHLAGCPACRERVYGPVRSRAAAATLRALLSGSGEEPGHLDPEQLLLWVDGGGGAMERRRVASHLAACAACRAEADDLSRFAAVLAAALGLEAWRRLAGDAPPLPPPPALAPPSRAAPPEPPRQPLLRDAGREIWRDAAGRLHGVPDAWREEVEAVLARPRLEAPASVLALVRRGERQRAEGAPEPPVRLEHPLSRVTLDPRPVLRWSGPPDAVYEVEVYDPRFELVAASGPLRETAWRPSAPLPRGELLTWKVRAGSGGSAVSHPAPPEPPAVFQVVSAEDARAIASARATGSRLLTGLALWRAGLIDEAAAELAALRRDNPGSPAARELEAAAERVLAELRGPSA